MNSRLVAAVAVVVLAVSAGAEERMIAGEDNDLRMRIEQWVAPLVEAEHLSGTLLVARGDIVLFERSYGMADVELAVANTPATRFNVASATKPLTLILLLSLMSDEDLEQPIARWFPDVPAAERITVRHLAEHRSGIPHRVTTTADETEPQTAATMAYLALHSDLLTEPGSERNYSSAGYAVLARVIELVGEASYEDLLDRVITSPVGALNTTHPSPLGLVPRRAHGYFRGARPIPAPPRDLSFLIGAGSLFSTPRDLFLIQRGVVDATYGVRVRDHLLRESGIRWNGYTNGYRTFADYHSETDLTVILTSNLFTGAADLIRDAIPRIAAGESLPLPAVPRFETVSLDPVGRTALEGRYRLGSTEQTLKFHDPSLASLGEWLLVPIAADQFFSPQDYAVVTAVSEEGRIVALQWGDGPRFPRVE